MFGAAKDDISAILEANARAQLDDAAQNVRSSGVDQATYVLGQKVNENEFVISARTVATIGPEIDIAALKAEIAGRERGDVETLIEAREGVRSVSVEFSPFWVFQIPNNSDKVTIQIEEN